MAKQADDIIKKYSPFLKAITLQDIDDEIEKLENLGSKDMKASASAGNSPHQ